MKCPKCSYTSFDYLDSCKRCGTELRDTRSLLQIIAVSPEDRAPSAPTPAMEEHGLPEFGDASAAYPGAPASPRAPVEPQEELLEGLDFDGSFDDLVEHTSYADDQAGGDLSPSPDTAVPPSPTVTTEEEEEADGLLDLDFGDLFDESKK